MRTALPSWRQATAIAVLALGLSTVPTAPVAAEDVGPLTDSFLMAETQVTGSYIPIPLRLQCNQGGASIFWYGPGTRPDSLWTNVIISGGGVSRQVRSVTVNGTYQPIAGDFDGNGCTDIFWYAPGPAPDHVWWFGANLTYRSTTTQVVGQYTPIVGRWGGAGDWTDDIFWYGPGSSAETIWLGSQAQSFSPRPAPQVTGTYRPATWGDDGILWHGPGSAPDHLWYGVEAGQARPRQSGPVRIDGVYETHTVSAFPFLYRSGPALDRLLFGFTAGGEPTTTAGNVPGGPHVVGANQTSRLIVFHVPGPGPDLVWSRG